MGCDINPYVEIKTDGVWASLNAPESLSDRNYARFAFLTGGEVINDAGVPALLPTPRGYPTDEASPRNRRRPWHNHAGYNDPSWFYILASLEAMLGGRAADELRIVFDFDQ